MTQWEHPGDANGALDVLPDGWERELDPDSGNTYYVNIETGATQWEKP